MDYVGLLNQFVADGLVEMTDKGYLWAAAMLLNRGNAESALELILKIENCYNRGVGMAYFWEVKNPGKTVREEFNRNVGEFNWLLVEPDECTEFEDEEFLCDEG